MKILFLSPATGMDYQCDTTLIGLKTLFGVDVVDINKVDHIYNTFPEHLLPSQYGRGFTICRTVEDLDVDRTDIDAKIVSKYFDLIVYGAIWRCTDKFELVVKHYPRSKIIAIDGEEPPNPEIHPYSKYTTYFKRELYQNYLNINPIQFSLPDIKLNSNIIAKNKNLANIIPIHTRTYIYSDEQIYYNDYAESIIGITMKKGGWDCMRHYEILGNNCIPFFIDLENCPEKTLTLFPKKILLNLYKTIDYKDNDIKLKESKNYYADKAQELFQYTKDNLVSSKITQKLLIDKL
jgi:hypothetical protein